MQEGAVGWDPTYIQVGIPWHVRLFIVYLFVVLCVGIVRWIWLANQAWVQPLRKWLSEEDLREGKVQADELAACALAGGLSRFITNPITAIVQPGSDAAGALLNALQRARYRFLFSWQTQYAKIQSTKRLVWLTLLVLALESAVATSVVLRSISMEKRTGFSATAGGTSEILTRLALGLLVSAVLYGAASYYESVLVRRKAAWNYFCDKCRDELASEHVVSVGTQQAN